MVVIYLMFIVTKKMLIVTIVRKRIAVNSISSSELDGPLNVIAKPSIAPVQY